MNLKDSATGLGGILMVLVPILATVVLGIVFIAGAAWASEMLLPWFSALTWFGLVVVIFVFLPLAIPRATRGFSSSALLISSHVFGVTLWMEGLLLTLSIWGVGAAFIGLNHCERGGDSIEQSSTPARTPFFVPANGLSQFQRGRFADL